jgi:hypothetical protein
MNKLFLFVMALLLSNTILAQTDISGFENEAAFQINPQELDSISQAQRQQHKVMFIMYDPIMHLPDPAGDIELVEEAKKDLPFIKKRIRLGLDLSVYARVAYLYETVDLMKEWDGNAANDLKMIYSSIGYEYKIPNRLTADNKRTVKEDETEILNGQINTQNKQVEAKYMNITINDPKLLPYLNFNYGTDLFLFITQLEIKKYYTDQADLSYGTYAREIKVHYSLFDVKGVQLAGDVIDVVYPVATNDIEEIIRNNFPDIARQIAASLPQPQRTAREEAIKQQTKTARELNKKSRKK